VADCTGRTCGSDGAGGSCGACADGSVCSAGKCVKAASGKCLDFFEVCTPACATWDLDCLLACADLLDPTSTKLAAAYYGCYFTRCIHCLELPDDQLDKCTNDCVPRMCGIEFSECYAQTGQGECRKIYPCIAGCAAADGECWGACYLSVWPNALYMSIQLELCAGCYGLPPGQVEGCIREHATGDCKPLFENCFGYCTPDCAGKSCGLDACGLSCGTCPDGQACVDGACG